MRSAERCLLATVLLLGGCGAAAPDLPDLSASATSQRTDEGLSRLSVAIVNDGARDVEISRARLAWGSMSGDWVPVGRSIAGHDAIAVKLPFRAGVCQPRRHVPELEVTLDGEPVTVPLRLHPGAVLDSIHQHQCSVAALDANARVSLAAGTTRGRSYLADIVVDRAPGSTENVRVIDVGGSVLLRMRSSLPATLADEQLRVPVSISPTPRCDPHAQSQSSQTFLLSAYLRVGSRDVRAILPIDASVRAELQRLIDRYCR